MKKAKKILAFAVALTFAAAIPCYSYADNAVVEIFSESDAAHISIYPEKDKTNISRYIYGVADKGGLYKAYPTVIKQTGTALSSYNWETNFSNGGKSGRNISDSSLVSRYPASKWSTPALIVDDLFTKSASGNIPVRLVTLPMMGYVAKDSMGIVSDDDLSRLSRWNTVKFTKNDTYLNRPNTEDDVVYIDEYVSYLVNRYGTSSEGGINGYFLDREPDMWDEEFSVLGLQKITPEELVERSAELAYSIKTIDSKAFVFGPSLSGLQGCIDLNDPDVWDRFDDNEYSWFVDYYLSEMRKKSEAEGVRLLDVFDIHYYTNATTPVGNSVISADDYYSNAYRMQATRTLWDPNYTENSVAVLLNKQFTPVLPTLRASIRLNYPGTRLSVSEYDFGGGNNMSGAIAQVDALGTFAKEEVYLACLSPTSDDFRFQEAALRLFTDYDGDGGSFGKYLIPAENDDGKSSAEGINAANDAILSSVYAACDDEAAETVRIIVTNKNMVRDKAFTINVDSSVHSYVLSEVYTIDSSSARIVEADVDGFFTEGSSVEFTAEPESVYMLVMNADIPEDIFEETEEPEETSETEESVSDIEESEVTVSETVETENTVTSVSNEETVSSETSSESLIPTEGTTASDVFDDPAFETVPDLVEETVTVPPAKTEQSEEESTSEASQTEISILDSEEKEVALPIKIIVTALTVSVIGGVIYILMDRK